uniref:Uncharacterized protein n=1 Tax=Anguilla anguilla TaxID=7936 RepID=A0A0E9W2K2_ANGAN
MCRQWPMHDSLVHFSPLVHLSIRAIAFTTLASLSIVRHTCFSSSRFHA